jgi:hypothetical protein
MKLILWLFLAFIFISSSLFSQTVDSIIVKTRLLSTDYYYAGSKLNSIKSISRVVRDNPKAISKIKAAETLATVGNIFGFAGGFLIGWPIGSAMSGEEANWNLAYAGGLIAFLGILYEFNSSSSVHDAVDIYNSSIQKSGKPKDTTTLDFYLAPTRVGLALRF